MSFEIPRRGGLDDLSLTKLTVLNSKRARSRPKMHPNGRDSPRSDPLRGGTPLRQHRKQRSTLLQRGFRTGKIVGPQCISGAVSKNVVQYAKILCCNYFMILLRNYTTTTCTHGRIGQRTAFDLLSFNKEDTDEPICCTRPCRTRTVSVLRGSNQCTIISALLAPSHELSNCCVMYACKMERTELSELSRLLVNIFLIRKLDDQE